jgi:hypothetical protein
MTDGTHSMHTRPHRLLGYNRLCRGRRGCGPFKNKRRFLSKWPDINNIYHFSVVITSINIFEVEQYIS